MKKNTENMRNRNNKNNNIFAEKVLCDVKGIIRQGVFKNEIFSVGNMKPNEFLIDFNRISKYGNRYYTKKIRNKYLNILFDKFEKGELDYISHDDGSLEFNVNSVGIREPFIEIELSDPKNPIFKLLFGLNFEERKFSSFSIHRNYIYITFVQPDAVKPNTFYVSWDMRKEYLRSVFEYMEMGYVKSIRMCQ